YAEQVSQWAEGMCQQTDVESLKKFCTSAVDSGLISSGGMAGGGELRDPFGVMNIADCVSKHTHCGAALVDAALWLVPFGLGKLPKGLKGGLAALALVRAGRAAEAESSVMSGLLQCLLGGANSFPAGTPVLLADGSTKPIEQVEEGDEVASGDAQ